MLSLGYIHQPASIGGLIKGCLIGVKGGHVTRTPSARVIRRADRKPRDVERYKSASGHDQKLRRLSFNSLQLHRRVIELGYPRGQCYT